MLCYAAKTNGAKHAGMCVCAAAWQTPHTLCRRQTCNKYPSKQVNAKRITKETTMKALQHQQQASTYVS